MAVDSSNIPFKCADKSHKWMYRQHRTNGRWYRTCVVCSRSEYSEAPKPTECPHKQWFLMQSLKGVRHKKCVQCDYLAPANPSEPDPGFIGSDEYVFKEGTTVTFKQGDKTYQISCATIGQLYADVPPGNNYTSQSSLDALKAFLNTGDKKKTEAETAAAAALECDHEWQRGKGSAYAGIGLGQSEFFFKTCTKCGLKQNISRLEYEYSAPPQCDHSQYQIGTALGYKDSRVYYRQCTACGAKSLISEAQFRMYEQGIDPLQPALPYRASRAFVRNVPETTPPEPPKPKAWRELDLD